MGLGLKTAAKASSALSPSAGDIAVYLCRDPVDFRMGINGLSVLVEATLGYDPFSRNLFCFVNKRRSRVSFCILSIRSRAGAAFFVLADQRSSSGVGRRPLVRLS